jgi:hypothetical protein
MNELNDLKQLVKESLSDISENINYPEDTLESFKIRYKNKGIKILNKNYQAYPKSIEIFYEDPTVKVKFLNTTLTMATFEKLIYSRGSKIRIQET